MSEEKNQPFRVERRKGHAWLLTGTANLLQTVLDANFADVVADMKTNRSNYNLYNYKEQKALERCVKMMRWQIKALRAVARAMEKTGR